MSRSAVEGGIMTSPGRHAARLAGLPGDPAAVARVVQGLAIHEFWVGAYGVTLTDERRDTVNLRRATDLLDAIVGRDPRPLDVARAPEDRVATNCRGFSVLAVTLLRAAGVPARARCGFGAYFTEGRFEDHWVAEFHDGARWRLVDAQIDEVQLGMLNVGFDLTDVPRDQFVVAGDAWQRCRAGADPSRYGLSAIGEAGDWWIAANLMRDAAALTGVELLPWDLWGVMPEPEDPIDVALFDDLAVATLTGRGLAELMADGRLRVPAEVYNVQHRRREPL